MRKLFKNEGKNFQKFEKIISLLAQREPKNSFRQ
jgi:hypothetical protein